MSTKTTQVEFAIKIKDPAQLDEIQEKLSTEGEVINFVSESGEARIVIETDKPWIDVHEVLEKNGYESALVGFR